MATKSMLAAKVADINRLINHQFTKEELEEKLRKQGTNDNKTIIYKKIQLDKRRQEALGTKNDELLAEVDAELQKLAAPKLAFGTTLVKPRSSEKTQQERLADLNRRNQKLNAENVRRAELEERRARRKAEAAAARGEGTVDRFARVKTRARTHYDVNNNRLTPKLAGESGSDASRPVTPGNGAATPNKADTPNRSATPSNIKNESKPRGGIPVIRHRPTDDENIAALDLDIDIEL